VKGLKLEGSEAPKRVEAAFLAYDDDLGRFRIGLPSPQPFLVELLVKSRECGQSVTAATVLMNTMKNCCKS
jgi:hypothetical protein